MSSYENIGAAFGSVTFEEPHPATDNIMLNEMDVPQESPPQVSIQYPPPWRRFIYVLIVILMTLLTCLDMTIIATAIPKITNEFNSINDIGWYGSAFLVCAACGCGFWGSVYRLFSFKWGLVASLTCFAVGSLICAVAQDSPTFIVGRAIAGWGTASGGTGSSTVSAVSVQK